MRSGFSIVLFASLRGLVRNDDLSDLREKKNLPKLNIHILKIQNHFIELRDQVLAEITIKFFFEMFVDRVDMNTRIFYRSFFIANIKIYTVYRVKFCGDSSTRSSCLYLL